MTGSGTGQHQNARAAGLLLAFVVVFTLLGASSALAISRATVLARAQVWIDKRVPYSQTHYYPDSHTGYRTDCSGFASMSWATGRPGWSTRSFHQVTSAITTAQLLPGDAMLKNVPGGSGNHIRIFYGWVDDAHTMYVAYEQTGPTSKSSIRSMASDLAARYKPTRYAHIQASPASPNLLRNPSFDVWATSWMTWPWRDGPVWWSVTGSRDATLTVHTRGVVKATKNSVTLLNPSSSTRTYTTMSQEVTVTPETTYAVSAWARTACAPSGLDVTVAYLNMSGGVLSSTQVRADRWGVNGSSFGLMTAIAASPEGAVRALITVRLAGGTTALSATETVAGTSAVLDEISLVRPQSVIAIKSSVTHSHIGQSAILSGSVTPTASVGATYTVYVQKPGSAAWVPYHTHAVYASGATAAWKCGYAFKRGMRLGAYHFKAVLPAFGQYLGSTTKVVSVTLK